MSSIPVAAITGLGSFLPETVLTNDDLARFLETSDDWIRDRTGIGERHVIDDGMATSDMGVEAGKSALADAGVAPEDVDLVICCTFTPDHPFPATASIIQAKLGCVNAGAFDQMAACTSFIAGLASAAMYVRGGGAKTVLVVGSDCATRSLDWHDRATAVIFGDAAAAAVVQADKPGMSVLSTHLGSDGNGLCTLYMPAGGSRKPTSAATVTNREHYIKMAGRATFKFAVRALADSVVKVCREAGLEVRDLDQVIPHQANARIIEAAAKRLEVDSDRVLINIDRYGNTVSASIGLGLIEARADGRIKPGSTFAITGMGAGLSWGGAALRWDEG